MLKPNHRVHFLTPAPAVPYRRHDKPIIRDGVEYHHSELGTITVNRQFIHSHSQNLRECGFVQEERR
jgi:hypothetical protein